MTLLEAGQDPRDVGQGPKIKAKMLGTFITWFILTRYYTVPAERSIS